ncbi:MAG: trypsin-like peptidase domain-containing protein [Lachnospiraceae bacterium]|nr:trypsin-like peptidase domain-containing protein [Lachnospiraceae bacterium]
MYENNTYSENNQFPHEEYKGYQTYPTNQTVWGEPERKAAPQAKTEKTGGFFRKAILSVSLGLCFGLFAGLGFYAVQKGAGLLHEEKAAVTETVTQTQAPINSVLYNSDAADQQAVATSITMVESDVSQMVEEVMPSMVSIVNTATSEVNFFGQKFTQDTPYSGSGIIVGETDKELLIVTNYHVVEDANKLEVTFIDDSVAEAQIKGTDADMDLAVISVSLSSLDDDTLHAVTVATLGNSDTLRLGERVVAIGNALGYGQSVTGGYISALNREVEFEDGQMATYIQTDAAINGGNSGGALLNMKGEVIGINSAKIGGSSVEGMGYAIPITSASPIIADLMERQTRNKVAENEIGYMGISLQAVTSDISKAYNMPVGIYVVSTEEGSAAQNAGIISGDIITKIDGQKVSSYEGLQKILEYYAVGDEAKVTVMRPENGEYVEHQFDITFGRRPAGR